MTTTSASSLRGRRAVVIGAGFGGLSAARALADHFEHVTVLERDELPSDPSHRAGIPQGRHAHALLGGGQRALEDLFPGFADDLVRAGAVPYRVGLENRLERPGYDPFPQRDLGWVGYSMSRPLVEITVRRRLVQQTNVTFRPRCRAVEVIAVDDVVTGVRCHGIDEGEETLLSDLVVDASGRGGPTLALLESLRRPAPAESTIGVDYGYASGVFDAPEVTPADWKLCLTFAKAPQSSRAALLLPLEGNRWIVSLVGRSGEKPPGDWTGFLDFAERLRTPTISQAIRRARPVGEVVRFGFSASVHRHFERCEAFPLGLLPFADSICRFNPVYGQGMTIAAQQACLLRRLLREGTASIAPAFLSEVQPLIDTPWALAALPDFIYPDTQGIRPPDFRSKLAFSRALNELAARDPAVHKLTMEVQHLLRPRTALANPELQRQVQTLMAEPNR